MEHLSTATSDHPAGRTTTATTATGGRHHRRALALAAAVAAVGLVGGLVACDGGGNDAGAAGPNTSTAPATTSPARETAPPATAAPSTTAPADASAGQSSSTSTAPAAPEVTPAGATVPNTADGYATATFDAWLHGNDGHLRKLATEPVADFLSATTPGEPGEWSGPACEGAAGSSYCSWTQPDAEFVLRIRNETASLGRRHAVVDAYFTIPAGGIAVWPFTTTQQAADSQAAADEGHQPWLLGAESVAVTYASAEFGWQDAGAEQVLADPSTYRVTDPASGARADITLAQPARQGDGGIWAVVRAGATRSS
jgi:hypothetical protein